MIAIGKAGTDDAWKGCRIAYNSDDSDDYPPVGSGKQNKNVNRRRRTSSLLFATTLLAVFTVSCSSGAARKPDLPASVSPGWSLKQMDVSTPPARLPQSGTPPVCWKADYISVNNDSAADKGSATVLVCGYRVSASAFDAAQRMTPAPNEVRFQKGVYFVVVAWNQVSQAGITTLVSAIERALPSE
jgi:hypothetical protein